MHAGSPAHEVLVKCFASHTGEHAPVESTTHSEFAEHGSPKVAILWHVGMHVPVELSQTHSASASHPGWEKWRYWHCDSHIHPVAVVFTWHTDDAEQLACVANDEQLSAHSPVLGFHWQSENALHAAAETARYTHFSLHSVVVASNSHSDSAVHCWFVIHDAGLQILPQAVLHVCASGSHAQRVSPSHVTSSVYVSEHCRWHTCSVQSQMQSEFARQPVLVVSWLHAFMHCWPCAFQSHVVSAPQLDAV